MEYKIDSSTKSDIIRFSLKVNENILVKPKSVISRTYSLQEKAYNRKTLWDKAIEKQKYKLTKISSQEKPGVLTVSPAYSGSINKLEPIDNTLLVASNAFLVSNSDISISINKKDFFKDSNLRMLTISDIQNIFVSACEGIITIELNEKQQTVINENYLIALDTSIDYKNLNENNSKHILKGPGKVYLHSRIPRTPE